MLQLFAPLHMMSPTLSKEQMSRELADDEIGEESPELVMSKRL